MGMSLNPCNCQLPGTAMFSQPDTSNSSASKPAGTSSGQGARWNFHDPFRSCAFGDLFHSQVKANSAFGYAPSGTCAGRLFLAVIKGFSQSLRDVFIVNDPPAPVFLGMPGRLQGFAIPRQTPVELQTKSLA